MLAAIDAVIVTTAEAAQNLRRASWLLQQQIAAGYFLSLFVAFLAISARLLATLRPVALRVLSLRRSLCTSADPATPALLHSALTEALDWLLRYADQGSAGSATTSTSKGKTGVGVDSSAPSHPRGTVPVCEDAEEDDVGQSVAFSALSSQEPLLTAPTTTTVLLAADYSDSDGEHEAGQTRKEGGGDFESGAEWCLDTNGSATAVDSLRGENRGNAQADDCGEQLNVNNTPPPSAARAFAVEEGVVEAQARERGPDGTAAVRKVGGYSAADYSASEDEEEAGASANVRSATNGQERNDGNEGAKRLKRAQPSPGQAYVAIGSSVHKSAMPAAPDFFALSQVPASSNARELPETKKKEKKKKKKLGLQTTSLSTKLDSEPGNDGKLKVSHHSGDDTELPPKLLSKNAKKKMKMKGNTPNLPFSSVAQVAGSTMEGDVNDGDIDDIFDSL